MNQARTKVLYVITKSNWGGAQRYVFDLATSLPREQFEVAVAFGGTGEHGAEEGELSKRLKEAGVRTIFVRAFARDIHFHDEMRAFTELKDIFRREMPEVVHLNSSKAGGLGALAAYMTGVPNIIFTSHGLPYDEDRGACAKAFIYLSTWFTFLLCDAVICISDDTAARAKRFLGVQKKVHLVHNGVSDVPLLERHEARRALAALNTGIPENALWIGTLSELIHNKGLTFMIEASARLRDRGERFALLILGSGDLQKELQEQIQILKLADTVFLLGFVPNARQYLKAFDILTLTSVKEGLPYVLLEAGQASLPVLASDIAGIADIVEQNVSGILTPPGDVAAIERGLSQLLDDQAQRERFARRLHERVAAQFSIESMLKATIALYASHRP